ncbi:flagellar hook-basal body complex protein FliE [Comamonas flocculans]|uniref:Flagellar hook-basal body complex protein FliE n=1 Tax=Comamonas flocculans TaxID=2597701 RepID=A0A5B8RV06_9BURK|nr:flagellar hook-basal body complex protein FliE [Comamonas flocculans]QEA12572.1 flagellar hook-basal body complex protein FliE [Comamonas flocculans]
MDLRISTTPMPLASALAARRMAQPQGATPEAGFSSALKGALGAVSQAQNQADELQKQVQLENPKVSIEETMVAIQKAQVGFQATLHVRNRLVQAYTDIMNMQV